jgi:zinc D-Ala-D-Ala dipeptidase
MICKPFRSRALEPMYLGTMATLSRARSAAATLLLLACGGRPAAVTSPEAPPLPTASDAAAESLLVDVGSVDSTIQLDVRYATRNNFTGEPLPGYDAPRVLLRREVSAALARVQARLRSGGLGLRVFDGYRPVRATLAMVDWAERTGRRELVDSGYIARRSRHNLGVAVDLTIVDLVSGSEVPMGTPFDTFAPEAHTANAEGRVQRYRQILVRMMESEGFQNYEKEWWHFSYPLDEAVAFDRVIR